MVKVLNKYDENNMEEIINDEVYDVYEENNKLYDEVNDNENDNGNDNENGNGNENENENENDMEDIKEIKDEPNILKNICVIINDIQELIENYRSNYKDLSLLYTELNNKNNIILSGQDNRYVRDIQIQKKLIEIDLKYIIDSRNTLYNQLYDELLYTYKSLVNFEIAISPEKYNNQDFTTSLRYNTLKYDIDIEAEGGIELIKVYNLIQDVKREIDKEINGIQEFAQEISNKETEGYNLKNLNSTIKSQITKLNIELSTNLGQLYNTLYDHYVRLYGTKIKCQYMGRVDNLVIDSIIHKQKNVK